MGIKLSIELQSPLSEDDRDLLGGIAVMTLAIANRQPFTPEGFTTEPQPESEGPQPCGSVDLKGAVCVSEVGHRGRHKYRRLDFGALN